MKKICLTGNGYTDKHFSDLKNSGFEVTHQSEHVTQSDLENLLPEFDAYVLGGDERLTSHELQFANKMKVVSFVGTGYTSFIDEAAAKKHNIAIKNTPAVMAPAVAEHTLGLLLGMQRKLFQTNWQVKNTGAEICHSNELSSICVGIIGMGAIGSRVARMLRTAFGSEVIYHSRTRKEDLEAELNMEFVALNELFAKADAIILAVPTNAETEFFIDDALLSQAKNGVIIINAVGARLIEPAALKKNIDNNKIAAVAFDGYYIEPLPKLSDDPYNLLSLPDGRFVVTPHVAAKTSQSWTRMVDMAVNNVINFF